MTEAAVDMRCAGVTAEITVVAHMAVLMMTEMIRRGSRLVLAIGAHCRPTELERYQDHEEDREPATHGAGL